MGFYNFVKNPGSSFAPSSIADMILGIDPTCTRTTSQWNDGWSGNNNHVIAGTNKPTLSTLNSQPVLTFAGVLTDSMETAGNTGLSGDVAWTEIAVVKSDTALPGFWGFGGFGASSGLVGAGMIWPSDQANKLLAAYGANNNRFTTDALSTDTKIVTVTKAAGGIAANTTVRVNGADVGTSGSSTNSPSYTNSPFRINIWTDAAATGFSGQIGAAFLFSRVLTGGEITDMETYLNGLFAAF